VVLVCAVPISFALSPSIINLPIDLALGVIMPLHANYAFNCVITDYVPQFARMVCRVGLLGGTLVSLAGILKLNLTGPGLTATLKALWNKPKK
jgi:succinate dehydrogenase (ubiquinone) membrane anchor subunit